MTKTPQHVHLGEFVGALKATGFVNLLGVAAAVGSGFGLAWLVDISDEHAALVAGAIFLMWEGFVLYEVVSRAGDQINALAAGVGECSVIVGPFYHASLKLSNGRWESEGVVWLGLLSERGSSVRLTMSVPPHVEIAWVNRGGHPLVWKQKGNDTAGTATYEVEVSRVDNSMTPLCQFKVRTDRWLDDPPSIVVRASGKTARGVYIEHTASVAILQEPDESAGMKPVDE